MIERDKARLYLASDYAFVTIQQGAGARSVMSDAWTRKTWLLRELAGSLAVCARVYNICSGLAMHGWGRLAYIRRIPQLCKQSTLL